MNATQEDSATKDMTPLHEADTLEDVPLNAEQEAEARGGGVTDNSDLSRLLTVGQLRPPPPKLPPDPPQPN
ncbi:MAG: hypothetical protein ACREAB_00240 [Blastocatellia bacterium]